jgi:uncharacterized protein (TIGR02271 family)
MVMTQHDPFISAAGGGTTMTNTMNPQSLIDTEVFDPAGDKIGKVGEVYLYEGTQQPAWITVKSGLFNHHETMVPLQGARMSEDGIRVGVSKDSIRDAPDVDANGRLSEKDSEELYRHYGINPGAPTDSQRTGQQRTGQQRGDGQLPDGRARDGQSRDGQSRDGQSRGGQAQGGQAQGGRAQDGRAPAGAGSAEQTEMIRSEERLAVGTEQVESGRVRLHKYVVTEQQQVSVPVSHEEVRVEREPISDADRGGMGKAGKLQESDQEVILHEERPVVRTETVPVERVRVDTNTVTEEQTVGGEVRKERVDVEQDKRK